MINYDTSSNQLLYWTSSKVVVGSHEPELLDSRNRPFMVTSKTNYAKVREQRRYDLLCATHVTAIPFSAFKYILSVHMDMVACRSVGLSSEVSANIEGDVSRNVWSTPELQCPGDHCSRALVNSGVVIRILIKFLGWYETKILPELYQVAVA